MYNEYHLFYFDITLMTKAFWFLEFGQAVTLHYQSYMNKMEIVLGADEQTVPDPHQLLEDLAESLKLIQDQVITRSS